MFSVAPDLPGIYDPPVVSKPAALLFDVFGTVVDWRGSIIAAGEALPVEADWGSLADEWRREGYLRPIIETVSGGRDWAPVESMLAESLDMLIDRHRITALTSADRRSLLSVWRRLAPWPDVVDGLTRLKSRYLIGPLSNGGFAMLTEMAKAGALPWDFVISAELFRSYKPSPSVYLGAARLLERDPNELMLVAAHPGDLGAARATGMQTALVPRPLEWGPSGNAPAASDGVDIVASDFADLADRLC